MSEKQNLQLICEICGPPLSYGGNHFELDRDRCGQRRDLDRCAGRVWFAGTCEILRINAVVDEKIRFHVSEKDRDVGDVLPGRASVFEHEPHILEYGMALCFDVVSHDVARGIERHAKALQIFN